MNRTLCAAVAAAAMIAAPLAPGFAQGTNAGANPSPPPPSAERPLGPGAAMPPMGGRMLMRHRMMMGMMHEGDRQEACIDRLAWRAARRAYIETKLDLNATQRPLWEKLETLAQQEEQKERGICDAMKGPAPNFVERMDRVTQLLSARLDGLRAAQPAIAALYGALTPAQRAILDHPFRRS